MKKILFPYIIFVTSLFSLTIISCQEDNSVEPNKELKNLESESFSYDSLSLEEINQIIIGKWEWNHSIIMQRSIHPPDNLITPDIAGYTKQYEFKQDGKVDFHINGELTGTYLFEVKRFKVLPDDKGFVTEIFIDGSPAQLLFFGPDSMMIGTGWFDGIDEYFSRE
jgi:hypothetical protein